MTLSPLFRMSLFTVPCPPTPHHPLFPLSLPFPLFRRRAGSGVTNYAERAEKVVWVLPSGLPSWIIIREIAGTQQPLAAGTATASVPAPGCVDPARFKPSSCLTGYLAPNNLPPLYLLSCRVRLICMSRHLRPRNAFWTTCEGLSSYFLTS